MFKVGLTGGIGSGKTTVANLFAECGVPIIDTDQIAREVVAPHTEAWQAIVDHFTAQSDPPFIDPETQQLNRRKLRDIIFKHPAEKKWLENLLHPLIRNEVNRQISLLHANYCIVVIPLLIESKHDYQLNRILVVDSTPELQVQRVAERDQTQIDQVQDIIATQVTRQQRLLHADDVIENQDISLESLRAKVQALHDYYLQTFTKKH